MSTLIKLQYTVDTVIEVNAEDKAAILQGFKAAKEADPADVPPGYYNAMGKVSAEFTDEQTIATIFAEGVSDTIKALLKGVKRVQYRETPEPLPPPEGTNVVVIDRRAKSE